jgi:PHD/YefM family antitoxin component YafN of YafNO toxin-antitoxin module
MEKIFSSTALRDNQREVKDAARQGVVRVTENGEGAFVFCSEDVFDRAIQQAVADAVYDIGVDAALARGVADVEAGRFVEGTDAARAAVAKRRAVRG